MSSMKLDKVLGLRIIHALFALYFMACLAYLYYAAFSLRFDVLLLVSMASLAVEGVVVFLLNGGDCPLIHIQRKIGDDKPFFEIFMPSALAKKAIPAFASLTIFALALLVLRFGAAM